MQYIYAVHLCSIFTKSNRLDVFNRMILMKRSFILRRYFCSRYKEIFLNYLHNTNAYPIFIIFYIIHYTSKYIYMKKIFILVEEWHYDYNFVINLYIMNV